jgi:hypothetical protein
MKKLLLFPLFVLVMLSASLEAGDRFGRQWDQKEVSGQQTLVPSKDIDRVDLSNVDTVLGNLTGLDASTLNGQPGSFYQDRTNHTGFQIASTISNFDSETSSSTLGSAFDNHTGTDPHRGIFDNLSISGTHNITILGEAAFLAYEDPTGFFEIYSTAGVFYKWQNNIDKSGAFGNLSASKSTGEITILAGVDDLYKISRDTGMHGEESISYDFAIFVNNSAVNESHTSAGKGEEGFPIFSHLSAYGTATYGALSSISNLFYSEKDQIEIIEADTGNGSEQWCFEYETHFTISHIPHFLRINNIQYNGGMNHFADVLTFDNLSSEWDDMRLATDDIENAGSQADYKNENLTYAFPNGGDQTRYILNGLVRTKLRHNADVVCSNGHTLWIDEMKVFDLLGPRSDSASVIVQLSAGDVITIREKPESANRFFHRHRTTLNVEKLGD